MPIITKNTVICAAKARKSTITINALPTGPALFLENTILQNPGTMHKQFINNTARMTSQLGNTRNTNKHKPNVWIPSSKKI